MPVGRTSLRNCVGTWFVRQIAWRRANANHLWRREQYGDFLRDLGIRLERLKVKCRNLADGE